MPKINSIWLHKNGDYYEVVSYSNVLSTNPEEYPLLLNYRRLKDGSMWAKSVNGFIRSRVEMPV